MYPPPCDALPRPQSNGSLLIALPGRPLPPCLEFTPLALNSFTPRLREALMALNEPTPAVATLLPDESPALTRWGLHAEGIRLLKFAALSLVGCAYPTNAYIMQKGKTKCRKLANVNVPPCPMPPMRTAIRRRRMSDGDHPHETA